MQVDVTVLLICLATSSLIGLVVYFGLVSHLNKIKAELINRVTNETNDSNKDTITCAISGNNNKVK